MSKIYLKGKLGQEFGEVWELNVKSPKEALHAINANTDGRFIRYLLETSKTKNIAYKFIIGDYVIDSEEKVVLVHGPHGNEDIYIVPVIEGAIPFLIQLAVAIIMAVVSAMLAPSPNIDMGSSSDTARKDSYLFSGGPSPAKQGKPIPLGYGRMMVYPTVISVQYEYTNIYFGNYGGGGDGGGGGDQSYLAHNGFNEVIGGFGGTNEIPSYYGQGTIGSPWGMPDSYGRWTADNNRSMFPSSNTSPMIGNYDSRQTIG